MEKADFASKPSNTSMHNSRYPPSETGDANNLQLQNNNNPHLPRIASIYGSPADVTRRAARRDRLDSIAPYPSPQARRPPVALYDVSPLDRGSSSGSITSPSQYRFNGSPVSPLSHGRAYSGTPSHHGSDVSFSPSPHFSPSESPTRHSGSPSANAFVTSSPISPPRNTPPYDPEVMQLIDEDGRPTALSYYPRSAFGPAPPKPPRSYVPQVLPEMTTGYDQEGRLHQYTREVVPAANRVPRAGTEGLHGEEEENAVGGDLNSLHDAYVPDTKPPYPYSTIIRYAIAGSPRKKLTLGELYEAMEARFPWYKTAGEGWKNSVRHTLSLTRCFVKVPRPITEPGRGEYWTFDATKGEGKIRPRKRPNKKAKGKKKGHAAGGSAGDDDSGDAAADGITSMDVDDDEVEMYLDHGRSTAVPPSIATIPSHSHGDGSRSTPAPDSEESLRARGLDELVKIREAAAQRAKEQLEREQQHQQVQQQLQHQQSLHGNGNGNRNELAHHRMQQQQQQQQHQSQPLSSPSSSQEQYEQQQERDAPVSSTDDDYPMAYITPPSSQVSQPQFQLPPPPQPAPTNEPIFLNPLTDPNGSFSPARPPPIAPVIARMGGTLSASGVLTLPDPIPRGRSGRARIPYNGPIPVSLGPSRPSNIRSASASATVTANHENAARSGQSYLQASSQAGPSSGSAAAAGRARSVPQAPGNRYNPYEYPPAGSSGRS